MQLLIISAAIQDIQLYKSEVRYVFPPDIQLDIGDLNDEDFNLSVFDYDVSTVHIRRPSYNTEGYYHSLPKLLQDSALALEHGRSIICLPDSVDFVSENRKRGSGMSAYDWLGDFGVELQDNEGKDIKPSGAGRAQVIREYLKYSPKYHQIVTKPSPTSRSRLAVVGDTEIVVGLEHQVGKGMLVILPPPRLDKEYYSLAMSTLLAVARYYYDRSQRHIAVGDAPDWLSNYLVPRAKKLDDRINKLADEKAKYDTLAYVLYGTGDGLTTSVALLLNELGLDVQTQPPGANIDLKARHSGLNIGFAVEVTGTKDIIRKDSNKVAQAWQHLNDCAGTTDENDRLVIVANTQYHLDPEQRNQEGYTQVIANLLGKNGALLITAPQLYELWKAVQEGKRLADDVIRELHSSSGLFGKSSSAS
jgi:hypothetical protein